MKHVGKPQQLCCNYLYDNMRNKKESKRKQERDNAKNTENT